MNQDFHPMAPDMGLYLFTALIPLLVGFLWYGKWMFGAAWMKTVGMTEESMKGANMTLIFILTYVFGFLLSVGLGYTVIHQFHLGSVVMPHPGEAMDLQRTEWYNNAMNMFGWRFRSYRHGAFHGFLFAVTALLPIIGVNGLFERRGGKYIFINWGFWAVCSIIMGAIICHWTGRFFI